MATAMRRLLKEGIGVRSIHPPVVSLTRSFFSHLISLPTTTPSALSHSPRPTQSIHARFSLPVRHALSRPFSPPRLPKPPIVPANVTHVGFGTARTFHSGRPIFQNMVDNVPIATRALWEAEWDLKVKKKEARRVHRAALNKAAPKSREMLKPKTEPLITESPSELDVYFAVESTPAVTSHLLIPLAPSPTARLPLSARSDADSVHPLLPISDLASIHASHRLHSLRVSTLFSRLDTANVWNDPGVNVDAYAFGPRHDAGEKQCTVLRVTFRGWDAPRVRAILGDSEEWYSLQEIQPDNHPTLAPLSNLAQDAHIAIPLESPSPSLESIEVDSCGTSEVGMDDGSDVLFPPPVRANASAQHDLVLPILDFSSTFSDTTDNISAPPRPVVFSHTVSELTGSAELVSSPLSPVDSSLTHVSESWEGLGLSSSFLTHVEGIHQDNVI